MEQFAVEVQEMIDGGIMTDTEENRQFMMDVLSKVYSDGFEDGFDEGQTETFDEDISR